MGASKIRVLIVEDSLVAIEMLRQILTSDPAIEVVGVASNGADAIAAAQQLHPDLITMDIHMPGMDGLEATEQIMAYNPTPILVVSSSVYAEGMGRAFDALTLGALDVIKKPEPRKWEDLGEIARDIISRVKILANVHVVTHIRGKRGRPAPDTIADVPPRRSMIAIASSTGGPSALLDVLGRLPKELPVPVVVVQHIADGFVPGLVNWLDAACSVKCVVGGDGDVPEPGVVYFAPTGSNMVFDGRALRVVQPAEGQLYVPNADVLFESVAANVRSGAIGVVLTGMGADGASGLSRIKAAGGATIAQDEKSSTVFGMPKVAIDLGAAEQVLPATAIAGAIERLVVR
ncbi:MAG TPA: chemotaxis-specific protein-glutamate methyltransferase CheB [Coriobacteriia bacterium]|nr:chemotaxis-specific protein-glutamate methyltransferase CheB [Coriobacteriia bacterium]